MSEFEYKVSVIVPVYNVEPYLRDCLDSLLAQTIDHEQMEVLLINDGSTDNSLAICQEYAEMFSCFKLFSKENEGLSATRNYGIRNAKGKYLIYLDSDDTFTPETLKSITDFFDTVYDEVDLVTYKIQNYKNGVKVGGLHYRYKYLTKSGVYDLKDYPYLCITNICYCVKNMGSKNIYFDTTPNFRHEDQAYASEILMNKQKLGYCSKGEYCYNRSNEGSIVTNIFHAFYIFETSVDYFERLSSKFDNKIPVYFQNMILSDMAWKLSEDKLFPYHYDKESFDIAIQRLKQLLSRVDSSTIYNSPVLDNFQKQYWLNMKPNVEAIVITERDKASIYVDGTKIYSRENMEIIMHKVRVHNKRLHLRGFLKSPIYNHIGEKAKIYVIENGDEKNKRLLDVSISIHSRYRANTQTNNFYAFSYHCDTTEIQSIKFVVELDNIFFKTVFWCMPVAVFDTVNGKNAYIRDNVKLTLNDNILFFDQMTNDETESFEKEQTLKYRGKPQVYNLRNASLEYRKRHHVWLYYDLYTVRKDNGYYQFINDFYHNDGIDRYYVYDHEMSDIEELFSEEQKKHLVKFGSEKHKLLYISAEIVMTGFFGFSTISPFGSESEEADYLDIIKFDTIYLQHGVLHASLEKFNHAERSRAEKIVVSSYFEKENYVNNYGYEPYEIISTGMSRYDHIDKTSPPKNRILFAPSWRKYLTNSITGSKWEVLKNKIVASDYYIKFNAFLTSPKLLRVLEEKDLYLDFKIHPIIKTAKDLFVFNNPRIRIAPDEVKIEDYQMFITDFSSFLFDFGFLSRPIMFFVPDMPQFKSGMNNYRELDLPWEKSFGNLTLEPEEAVDEAIRLINNDFVPDPVFKERMDNFYLPLENCAEKLYQYLTNKNHEGGE